MIKRSYRAILAKSFNCSLKICLLCAYCCLSAATIVCKFCRNSRFTWYCSDHDPLLINLQRDWTCGPVGLKQHTAIFYSKPLHSIKPLSDERYLLYIKELYFNLGKITMLSSALSGSVICDSCEHEELLNSYANKIHVQTSTESVQCLSKK